MNTTVQISALSIFVFLGVFQGLLISSFLMIRRSPNSEANRFQGLLLLALSLCILEQFLNMTGVIVKALFLTNTTEPLNLVIGPFLYLYIKRSLQHAGSKKELIHFILPIFYLAYMFFDYIQPSDFKYNSYVYSYHPDWPTLDIKTTINNDPLDLKRHLNFVTALQISFYIVLSLYKISFRSKAEGSSIIRTTNEHLKSMRNMVLHISAIVMIFVVVKLNFRADLGDYFIGIYVAVFTLLTTVRVMRESAYFDGTATFIDIRSPKYSKSTLTEERKLTILNKVRSEMESNEYYLEKLASLSELSRKLGESQNHVSQVINEKLGMNFFELIAGYRIERAKKIISDDIRGRTTIEEISEQVGYNSKTAFNNAFKKLTGMTPSQFRALKRAEE
jgi:AraC-like DNA-binding protein